MFPVASKGKRTGRPKNAEKTVPISIRVSETEAQKFQLFCDHFPAPKMRNGLLYLLERASEEDAKRHNVMPTLTRHTGVSMDDDVDHSSARLLEPAPVLSVVGEGMASGIRRQQVTSVPNVTVALVSEDESMASSGTQGSHVVSAVSGNGVLMSYEQLHVTAQSEETTAASAQASATPGCSFPIYRQLLPEDTHGGEDEFSFAQYSVGSGDEYDSEKDEQEAQAHFGSFENSSLHLTTRHPEQSDLQDCSKDGVPPMEIANTAPSSMFDYSNSFRLLPKHYYKEFGSKLTCTLAVSKTQDVDHHGNEIEWQKRILSRRRSKAKRRCVRTLPLAQKHVQRQQIEALKMVKGERYITDLCQLQKLISPKCYWNTCTGNHMWNTLQVRKVGATLVMSVTCDGVHRHTKKWSSSPRIQNTKNTKASFFAINTLLPSAIIMTGNQFRKTDHLFKALNIGSVSRSLFHQNQKWITKPVIERAWDQTTAKIADTLKDNNMTISVAGDGQNDSPGKCASYLTYSSMIVSTHREVCGQTVTEPQSYILSLEVVEKRHSDLKSVNMEVAGFLKCLLFLCKLGVQVLDICTDAHVQIRNIMKLSKENPAAFIAKAELALIKLGVSRQDIQHLQRKCSLTRHALDPWHRAKNIGKAFMAIKSLKKPERERLAAWIPSIKNHLWFCCEHCGGDVKRMQNLWESVVHHVVGEHTWDSGSCTHKNMDNLSAEEAQLHPVPLQKNSAEHRSVFKVVSDQKLLRDLKYYVDNRHTGALECFHQVTLTYCNKRTYYGYVAMTIRKLMAAIDNNHHVHRMPKLDNNGCTVVRLRWSKRASNWISVVEKEQKTYDYLPYLVAAALFERGNTEKTNRTFRSSIRIQNDPLHIAPNTAAVPRPKSAADIQKRPRGKGIICTPKLDSIHRDSDSSSEF